MIVIFSRQDAMKVLYDYNHIRQYKKPVVALGVFDGMHKGHRLILKAAVKTAKEINGTSIVITFYPHPQKKHSLYSLRHRLSLIEELGIDVCIVINFNRRFSAVTAEDFIRDVLIKRVNPAYIYIGRNFRFGSQAKGDYRLLDRLSGLYNYKLKVFSVLTTYGQAISSTQIRRLITKGDLTRAQKLLSRPVTVFGTVTKGISLAKRLGFPTANINPHHEILPAQGVYLVKVIVGDPAKRRGPVNKYFNGVCNVGFKPTLNYEFRDGRQEKSKRVEVYILDFNRNIYRRDLKIEFVRKIRDERKFSSLDLLAAQIKKDVSLAERYFSS